MYIVIKCAFCIVTYIICNILVGGKSPKSGTLTKPVLIIRLKYNQKLENLKYYVFKYLIVYLHKFNGF